MQAHLLARRFEVVELAGVGGMGRVYRARDAVTGALAAVKVLHTDSVEQARFEQEGAILAELQHPGIVRHLAHGRTTDGELYLAMEWLEGEPLSRRLQRQSLSPSESLTLGLRVAEGLKEAHRRGIVHRDIKPGNLFLVDGSVERVKILDFGVARTPRSAAALTHTGAMIGTLGFMAPEQMTGAPDIDARVDVFSLGCVLFQCFTGQAAFPNPAALAGRLEAPFDQAHRLRDLRRDIPPALDDLIARMLARSPADRPRDGGALVIELAAIDPLPTGRRLTSAPPPALTATEQRLLCLLVARAAHPSTQPARDDAGAGKRLVEFEAMIERHGGRLHVLEDGALVVAVADADAAADQALKVARCALAVRALVGGFSLALVAGRATFSGPFPTGTAIERGVELLTLGSSTEIRLESVIASLLSARFDVRHVGESAWLVGERDASAGARTLLGAPTPCVGRDAELLRLASFFEECVSEPIARAVLVTAPAGVGKSRLQSEFIRRIRQSDPGRGDSAPHIWLGRADLISAGSPFAILASAMRSAFGVHRALPLPARQEQILAQVARHFEGAEGARIAALLGELMGVSLAQGARDSGVPPNPRGARDSGASLNPRGGRDSSASLNVVHVNGVRVDPASLRDQMLRAFLDWLRAEAKDRPVLIVLEDLHWGDLPSISFIDAALRSLADLPILVLALARPEIHDTFPRLWADRPLAEVKLGPLSRRASERMVRGTLGDKVPPEVVEAVVTRGAGNAFYLEELIRAVAEGRSDTLPETVLAMAEARLNRLDVDSRRVLRAASVFGEVFWRGGVLALLGGEAPRLDDLLADLARREVIERRDAARIADDDEYAFRHALMRDAAYAMLTEDDKACGHALAGAFLERAGEEDAIMLAEHFERGGEPAHAVGWYQYAARQALAGSDLAGTIARAARAIACGAAGEALGELRLLQAEAHTWRNEPIDASPCWAEALAVLPEGSSLWWQAAGGMLMIDMQLGDLDRFNALAQRLPKIALPEDALGLHVSRNMLVVTYLCTGGRYADAHAFMARLEAIADPNEPSFTGWMGWARCILVKYLTADPWRHLKAAEASAEGFQRTGNRIGTIRIRIELGIALRSLGAFAEAEQLIRESLTAAAQLEAQFLVTIAENHLSVVLREVGRLDEAETLARSAADAYLRNKNWVLAAGARVNLAMILLSKGELGPALREATEAADTLRAPPARAFALALKAKVRLARGEAAEALSPAEEAMTTLRRLGAIPDGDAFVRLVYAEALHAAGRIDAAREALAEARERLLARAGGIEDLRLRRRFLENIDEHRRTLARAAR